MDVLSEFGVNPIRCGDSPVGPFYYAWWASRLPPAWFAALVGYNSDSRPSGRVYASEAEARTALLAAWDRLPEADRAAIRIVLSGRRLAAAL